MSRGFSITSLLLAAALPAFAQTNDLLRFSNGDQLHGSFQGISEGPLLSWQRDDLPAPVEFKPSQVRQIVLRGGRPEVGMPTLSNVVLVNGDKVAGNITSLDADFVTVDTSFAGALKFPRNSVAMLAPSPLGGRVLYQGPFSGDEWKVKSLASPSEDEKPEWNFSGAAWYCKRGRTGAALVQEEGMPDRSVLRFNVAWKTRLSLAVAFHADFTNPEEPGEKEDAGKAQGRRPGDASSYPWLFGNSYVLQIASYVMLYRVGFDSDGSPIVEPIRSSNSNLSLGESGEATVEIRCSRDSGDLSLFVNDEFVSQWSEGAGREDGESYSGKGGGYGFAVQSDNTAVRISEIVLAEWNGMPDSARSLQTDDQDIVLLANGTDRFSGKVGALEDGKVLLDGKYGGFQFPLDDIAEIRFAKNDLVEPTEAAGDHLSVRMRPLGKVSGQPVSGDANSLKLVHPYAGQMTLDLSSAVILEFNPSNSFLDDWDEQF